MFSNIIFELVLQSLFSHLGARMCFLRSKRRGSEAASVVVSDCLHRTFFQEWTNSCRQGSPLAQPTKLPCAPQPLVAGSRRWRHRVRLDEAVISSAEGGTLFGLCEPLSPSRHLPTRVPPPPSRCCQSLTTGALGCDGACTVVECGGEDARGPARPVPHP